MSDIVERLRKIEGLIKRWSPVGSPDECWQWTGPKFQDGYGRVNITRRTATTANRAIMLLRYGYFPPEIEVCHKCDNRGCVNPEHLFLGTTKDNAVDKAQKGRCHAMPGQKNPSAKLTEQDVIAILSDTKSHTSVARQYGVSTSLVYQIRTGRLWKHLTRNALGDTEPVAPLDAELAAVYEANIDKLYES